MRAQAARWYALLDSPAALAAWMLDHATDSYEKISLAFLDGQPSGNLTHEHVPPADTRPLEDPELFLSTSTLADPAVVDDLEDARSQS